MALMFHLDVAVCRHMIQDTILLVVKEIQIKEPMVCHVLLLFSHSY